MKGLKKNSQDPTPTQGLTRGERNVADADSPFGMGATNVLDRIFARLGFLNGVKPEFVHCCDVANAGVLFALPALLNNGLLDSLEEYWKLPPGYYTLQQIFLVISFLALCRIKTFEQLRYTTPGEWGKVLGIDRIPEVKTLRRKIDILSEQQNAENWSSALSKKWMESDTVSAGILCVDGHTRVYHGKQTKLPRHYLARERLCVRATVDYWVNAMDGKPFFCVNKVVDGGLLAVLREEIIPALSQDVPSQPSEEQLALEAHLHRFTVIFDREGYSPDFMSEMKKLRIAIITYHKFPKENWDSAEFAEYSSVDKITGATKVLRLAERGSRLSNGLWVREIRCIKTNDHQSAILSTDYISDLKTIAVELFARWSQENYFKYMRENYNLDKLSDYSTEEIPETTKVVNPEYRTISSKVKSVTAKLSRLKATYGEIELIGDIEPEQVESYSQKKAALQQEIEAISATVITLKEERKKIPSHIQVKDLPKEQQFKALSYESKHLIDTIKMISYRAECALVETIKEYLTDKEDARMLIKRIFVSDADLIPDNENKTLTVRLPHQICKSQDRAIRKLCEELNETQEFFPGSGMRLVYDIAGSQVVDT